MHAKVNLNKLVRNLIILVIFIAIIILIICIPNSGEFLPNVNKSRYRNGKNAEELKQVYEQEGNKEKFLLDVANVQNAVSMALLTEDVVDEKSMNERVKEINKELKQNDWEMLGIDVPTFWVGIWSINKKGTVKFTFLNKESLPNWAYEEDVKNHIILDI